MSEMAEQRLTSSGAISSDQVDILSIYFREISRFPVLSAEEERKVARAMDKGIDGARERLITSNLRLVVKIAREYAEAGLPLIDLIQEGNVGLIEAVDRFDVERGYKLSTYASWWIRRAILSALTDYSRMIRIPDYLFRAVRRFEQMRRQDADEDARQEEITQALGISVERLRQIQKQVSDITSLDRVLAGEGDEVLEDFIEDKSTPSPEHEALRLLFHDELKEVINDLPARQAFALRLHYGIEDGVPYNLSEVGRIMSVSRERARQLVNQGVSNISEAWGERALDFYRGLISD
jgi:RNA polymerase primary sigma factor